MSQPTLNPVCVCGREIPRSFVEAVAEKGFKIINCSPENGGCGSKLSIGALMQDELVTGGRCHRCHQKLKKLNPHVMCLSKWRVLDAMAQLHQKGYEWIKVEHGRGLIAGTEVVRDADGNRFGHIERHVGRLCWFNLVERKGKRSGDYRVTDEGYSFLAGKTTVPAKILCREGEVHEETEERVSVRDIKNIVLDKDYWDRYGGIQE